MNPNENQPVQQLQPAPQPAAPAPAPAQPSPAPQPVEQAPLTPGVANDPVRPVQPEPPVAPAVEPAQPLAEQPKPEDGTGKPPEPTRSSYEEQLLALTDKKPTQYPKASEVDNSDPENLDKFFRDLAESAKTAALEEMNSRQAIQQTESRAWGEAIKKYPELESNQELRDTIHNIRMGAFTRGKAVSPTEAADALIGTLHNEYKRGVNDTNVQTSIQESQPLNGGGQQPPVVKVDYARLQDGGREEAVSQIQAMIDAGKI